METETFTVETFTVKQVFDALAKDGFEHLRSQWTAQDMNGVITGACVLGQAAINLGVEAENDEEDGTTLFEQLNKLSVDKTSKWYNESHAGSTIVAWNDLVDYDDYDEDGNNLGYRLKTYGEVTAMAYDVLSPHFDTVITLEKKEWKIAQSPEG